MNKTANEVLVLIRFYTSGGLYQHTGTCRRNHNTFTSAKAPLPFGSTNIGFKFSIRFACPLSWGRMNAILDTDIFRMEKNHTTIIKVLLSSFNLHSLSRTPKFFPLSRRREKTKGAHRVQSGSGLLRRRQTVKHTLKRRGWFFPR